MACNEMACTVDKEARREGFFHDPKNQLRPSYGGV